MRFLSIAFAFVMALLCMVSTAEAATRHHKAHAAAPVSAAAPPEPKVYMQMYPESSGNRFRLK